MVGVRVMANHPQRGTYALAIELGPEKVLNSKYFNLYLFLFVCLFFYGIFEAFKYRNTYTAANVFYQ